MAKADLETSRLLHQQGDLLLEQGKFDEAESAYRRALRIEPGLADTHYRLGLACQRQGKIDDAVIAYQQTIAIAPDHGLAHSGLGDIFAAHGLFDAAEAVYRRFFEVECRKS